MTKKEQDKISELLRQGISEIDCTYRYGYLPSIVAAVKRQVEREGLLPGSEPVPDHKWYQARLFE